MEISVSLLEGQKQSAKFGDLEVISDQSINAGGCQITAVSQSLIASSSVCVEVEFVAVGICGSCQSP